MKLPGTKDSHKDKVSRNPIKIYPSVPKKKPAWLKIELPHSENFKKVKEIIHQNNLHTVCEEASCPNIGIFFLMELIHSTKCLAPPSFKIGRAHV